MVKIQTAPLRSLVSNVMFEKRGRIFSKRFHLVPWCPARVNNWCC